MSVPELFNGAAVLGAIGLFFRIEARITRLETILETVIKKVFP